MCSSPSEPYTCTIDEEGERSDKSCSPRELFLNVGDKLQMMSFFQIRKEVMIIDFARNQVVVVDEKTIFMHKFGLEFFKDTSYFMYLIAVNNVLVDTDNVEHLYVKRNPKRTRELISHYIAQ